MAYTIPFHRDVFVPKTIPGNADSDTPVTFELSMAAGPDRARLKSLLFATAGLAGLVDSHGTWSPEIQASVVEAFRMGPQLFENSVRAIRNLTAPAILCRLAGIRTPATAKDEDGIPITTGADFAKVAPYLPELALEVAFAIQQLTVKGEIDLRFFGPPSGSAPSPATTSGSATAAPTPSDDGGTAGA